MYLGRELAKDRERRPGLNVAEQMRRGKLRMTSKIKVGSARLSPTRRKRFLLFTKQRE